MTKPYETYQHLEGTPMTDRDMGEVGSKFWNKGKWDNFVAPFLPEMSKCAELSLVDMGCNAGVFLNEAELRGFKTVIGVDSNKGAVERGAAWAKEYGKSYKFVESKMQECIDDLPMVDYTVLANAHYYFTINDWLDYLDKLQAKTAYCIIVTAEKRKGNRCWASTELDSIRSYFKTWEEVGFIDGVPLLEGDPHPRKLWGLCFKSPSIERVAIDALDSGNHVQDKFCAELDAGKHYTETRYYKILKPYRKRWSEERLHKWMEARITVYESVKKHGMRIAPIANKDNLILDGNHRHADVRHLGDKSILIRRVV